MQLVAIGDSIVHGGIDAEMGGWVARLKVLSMSEKRGDHVFNLGLGGNTSRMILARTEAEIAARVGHVQKVLFSTGTNDMNIEMPLAEFKANLAGMGSITAGFGKQVFFMGLFLRTDRGTPEMTAAYDSVIQEVCREGGYTYIPTADVITAADLLDGCHPDAGGHAKLCTRVAEYVRG